jgi:hypothetical protein
MPHQLGFAKRTMLWTLSFGIAGFAMATARGDDGGKEKSPITAKAAFEQLKTLKGTWKNKVESKEHPPSDDAKVIYRLTGAGSALMETDFPESDHEMVSVYHLDGDDLRMTHYCAAGNQPRLKLDRVNSSASRLVFLFDGGSNLDPSKDMHIHGMTMTFGKDGDVDCAWDGYMQGKSVGITRFQLSRPKS